MHIKISFEVFKLCSFVVGEMIENEKNLVDMEICSIEKYLPLGILIVVPRSEFVRQFWKITKTLELFLN